MEGYVKPAERTTRKYAVKFPVDVRIGSYGADQGAPYLSLDSITSVDPEENDYLNDGHDNSGEEFAVWDNGLRFADGGLVVEGSDGPSGGFKEYRELTIPQHLIRSIAIEHHDV